MHALVALAHHHFLALQMVLKNLKNRQACLGNLAAKQLHMVPTVRPLAALTARPHAAFGMSFIWD
jgi:hypothetical protein